MGKYSWENIQIIESEQDLPKIKKQKLDIYMIINDVWFKMG